MDLKFIIYTIFCSFISHFQANAQNIEIFYHVGFRCEMDQNGVELIGACQYFEKMEYVQSENSKFLISKNLEVKNEERPYQDGEFTSNIIEDSLKIYKFHKRLKIHHFNKLVTYLDSVERHSVDLETGPRLQNHIVTVWNEDSFLLNPQKIRHLKKEAEGIHGNLNNDSLMTLITKFVKEENVGIRMSSVVEFLSLEFEHEGKSYEISLHHIDGMHLTWNVGVGKESIFIIAPELNLIVEPFLHRRMRAKKRILEFSSLENIKEAVLDSPYKFSNL